MSPQSCVSSAWPVLGNGKPRSVQAQPWVIMVEPVVLKAWATTPQNTSCSLLCYNQNNKTKPNSETKIQAHYHHKKEKRQRCVINRTEYLAVPFICRTEHVLAGPGLHFQLFCH